MLIFKRSVLSVNGGRASCPVALGFLIVLLMHLQGCAVTMPGLAMSGGGDDALIVPPEASSQRIIDNMQQASWPQAREDLQSLLAENPMNVWARLNLAIVLESMGDTDEAASTYKALLGDFPDNIRARNRLALLFRKQGRYGEAQAQYERALLADPLHANTHRNLGILFDLYLGQLEQAVVHYEASLAAQAEEDDQLTLWIADLQLRMQEQRIARLSQ